MPPETVFLTTQPGWAFATLAELRAIGVEERVEFCHRDSTLVLSRLQGAQAESGAEGALGTRPAHALGRAHTTDLLRERLRTPAEGYLTLAMGTQRGGWDATRILGNTLRQESLREPLWDALDALGRGPRARAFTLTSESWGLTAIPRRELGDLLRSAVRRAFPKWEERPAAIVRLLCKADTRVALAGVQTYANLDPHERARPGSLREHLAYGLLAVAGVQRGDAVLDPFAGSGTILRAAAQSGAAACIGVDADRAVLRLAQERVHAPETRLLHGSFEALDVASIPEGTRLVSNLPFGVQFEQVSTARLYRFLEALRPRLGGAALLMAREQAAEVAADLGLRVKHVIVLGQPAAIAYSDRPLVERPASGRRPVRKRLPVQPAQEGSQPSGPLPSQPRRRSVRIPK